MTRPHDIIASHGGNPARWPAAERGATLAALRRDADLRGERDAALRLDALLDEWASRDLAGGDAGAAAARALAPVRPWPRWAAGGAVAAVLGAAVMLNGPQTISAPAATAATLSDEGAFASLFTTTPDEESVI